MKAERSLAMYQIKSIRLGDVCIYPMLKSPKGGGFFFSPPPHNPFLFSKLEQYAVF